MPLKRARSRRHVGNSDPAGGKWGGGVNQRRHLISGSLRPSSAPMFPIRRDSPIHRSEGVGESLLIVWASTTREASVTQALSG